MSITNEGDQKIVPCKKIPPQGREVRKKSMKLTSHCKRHSLLVFEREARVLELLMNEGLIDG